MNWLSDHRPGYFGRKRDAKVAALNELHGKDKWRLSWVVRDNDTVRSAIERAGGTRNPENFDARLDAWVYSFAEACVFFYEASYVFWLAQHPGDLDFICSHGECIDNEMTNIQSGRDYLKQESWATHIQDIAMRNALRILERKFEGPEDKILIIRSADSNGFRYGPGNIPLYDATLITPPSLCPKWAKEGSVEAFWQSNKWVQIQGG